MPDEIAVEKRGAQLDALTTRDLLDRLSSSAPIPGGGSASALSAAMGAGLVAMVAALTAGRPEYAEVERTAVGLGASAAAIRDKLLDLANEDSDAYDAVVRARRLPRGTDDERAIRSATLSDAMHLAADVPMRTARAAMEGLVLASRIAPIGNKNAVSDAGVAALLLAAGVRGAVLNVRINLPYLPEDDALRQTADGELADIEREVRQLEADARAAADARLG